MNLLRGRIALITRASHPDAIDEATLFPATTPATFLQGDNIVVDGGYINH